MNPYENLANAIIIQAATDYRKALVDLKRNNNYKPAIDNKAECECFFHSAWFGILSQINPEMLISKIAKEVDRY